MSTSKRSPIPASVRPPSFAALAALAAPAALAALAAATIAGCGSHTATTPVFHPLRPPTRRADRHATPPPPARPSVGATQRVDAGGTTLSVTVHAVIDPLHGSGAALPRGARAVGVVAEIRNDGPGTYDSSSTGDFSVVPASGPARPVFAPSGSCATPLRDWDNDISPGGDRSGCVAFTLDSRARVSAIQFSPHATARGRAIWLASR